MPTARDEFFSGLLSEIGAPDTPSNRRLLESWAKAEGTQAAYNPLATTKSYEGASDFNSAGVKNYPSLEAGVKATAETLRLSHYKPLVAQLQAGDYEPHEMAQTVAQSPWGTGRAILRVVNAMVKGAEAAEAGGSDLDAQILAAASGGKAAGKPQGQDADLDAQILAAVGGQAKPPEAAATRGQPQSAVEKMVAPVKRVPSAISEEFKAGTRAVEEAQQAFPEHPIRSTLGMVGGGLRQFFSPVTGSTRALLSEPVEATTGIPKEYTEMAAQAALPVAGASRLGGALARELPGAVGAYLGAGEMGGAVPQVTRPANALKFAPSPVAGRMPLRPDFASREEPNQLAAMARASSGGADWSQLTEGAQNALADIVSGAGDLSKLTPEMQVRAARMQGLPVPVTGTRGQLSRDPVQLRLETQVSQTPAGGPLRELYVEQNRAIQQSLDVLKGRTKAQARTAEDVGRAVVDKRMKELEARSDAAINAKYEAARAAGEMTGPVDASPLLDYLGTHPDPQMVSYVAGKLKAIKALGADANGDPVMTRPVTLEELEGIRKAAVAAAKDGGTRGHYAGEVKGVIDKMTEGAGGELYQEARAAFRQHKRTFDDPEAIRDILGRTRTGDRRTALEDVWRRTVLGGSIEDLTRVKRTLLSGGGLRAGIASWREVQGATLDYIKDAATKSATLDEAGRTELSTPALKKAIDRIGPDKLKLILGRKTAREVDNILAVSQDVKTLPPKRIGGSDTALNLIAMADRILGSIPGVRGIWHVGRGLVHAGQEAGKAGRSRSDVERALSPMRGMGQPPPLAIQRPPVAANALYQIMRQTPSQNALGQEP